MTYIIYHDSMWCGEWVTPDPFEEKKASALYRLLERGHIVPELKEYNILQYRKIIIDPWRVIYKVAGKKVFVMSVIDSRRNVEDILLDRLVNHIN